MSKYRYEAVPGYFLHDDSTTFPMEAIPARFGLIDDSSDRWRNLFENIRKLNEEAKDKEVYKFFLLSRHGEGYHNVAIAKYGLAEWNRYWSTLDGDGELVWGPDPELTPTGIEQAVTFHEKLVLETTFGLGPPHIRYCSPLTRALQTASVVFDGTFEKYPTGVIVKENCRETIGVHTCDKRRTVSYITSRFPTFEIEGDMMEEDLLWSPTVRETQAEIAARVKNVLDEVFESCGVSDTFISITGHSGFINGFMKVIGRESVIPPTGGEVELIISGVLPVVVKAEISNESFKFAS